MPFYPTYANRLNRPLLVPVTTDTIGTITDLLVGTHAAAAQPCIIPVNYLAPGSCIYTRFAGTYSSLTGATLILGTYYGTTALAIGPTITLGTTPTAWPFIYETWTDVRSTSPDTACVTMTSGILHYGASAATWNTPVPIPNTALATVNVDNTASQPWTVKATFGASNASNIVVLHSVNIVEISQS
jgi:hypothetical protein